MMPKELVRLAISRAMSIISNDLERLEFIYEHPIVNVSEVLVDDFVEYSFKNLVALINTYRKGHKGESNRKITHGDDRFYLVSGGSRHFFYMNDYSGVRINWIPYDLDEILCEFANGLINRSDILENFVSEYWIARKAGDIAKTTIDLLLKDVLDNSGYRLRIACGSEGYWKCILQSNSQEDSIAFFSSPEKIIEDISRILSKSQ